MEIDRIVVHRFTIPLEEPFVTNLRPVPELERVLIEIETDEGLVGFGEGAPGPRVTGETRSSVAETVEEAFAPALLGENPLRVERLVRRMNAARAEVPTAKAAVELALQDLRGKRSGVPLYQLLGGHADEPSIEAPTVLSLSDPDEMAAAAEDAVDDGYDQFKIKLGDDPEADVDRVRAVDRATPDDASLKADANQGWREAKTAASVLRRVGDVLDVVEQPVDEDNVEDLAFLRRRFDVPIMPDESVWSPADALSLIKRAAGDVFNIKLMKTGGIRDAARLNAVTAANHCRTQIGSMPEGHVGTAAGVHFALAFENVARNEMVGPFMTTTGITDLTVEEPRITVSGPGLGVSVDRDELDALTDERREISR